MRKKLYNMIGSIHFAPNRQQLLEFGGPMSIEEFRKYSTMDTGPKTEINIAEPEKVITNMIKPSLFSNNSSKLFKISDSKGINEPLRLKRPTPLKRDENNLEKTLGITRKKISAIDALTKP